MLKPIIIGAAALTLLGSIAFANPQMGNTNPQQRHECVNKLITRTLTELETVEMYGHDTVSIYHFQRELTLISRANNANHVAYLNQRADNQTYCYSLLNNSR